jgi:predicted solute-binding protein
LFLYTNNELSEKEIKKNSIYYSIKNNKIEPGVVVHACNLSYMGGRGRRITSFGTAWEKVVVRPCLKNRN